MILNCLNLDNYSDSFEIIPSDNELYCVKDNTTILFAADEKDETLVSDK